MYRVILADDEKWSIFGLTKMITWAEYQCQIIDTAPDGLAALEKCRLHRPDILFTDIRMPGMDGLALARALAMELPDITVILITGYNDLSYAQRALRLGVFDFLLKQITAKDLDTVLKRYLGYVHEKSRVLSSSFFFSFFDESNSRTVAQCMEALCIQAPYAHAYAVTLLYGTAVSIHSAQIRQIGDELFAGFHTGSNRITCYCFTDADQAAVKDLNEALGLGTPLFAGVSNFMTPEASFFELYHQSSLAVLTAQFWQHDFAIAYAPFNPADLNALVEPLRKGLVSGDSKLVPYRVDTLWDALNNMQLDALEYVLNRATVLLAAFQVSTYENDVPVDLYQYASAGGTASEFYTVLKANMKTSEESSDSQQLITRILAYIDMRFSEDIRISEVAEKFFLNVSYLSTLIRKRTGKTYSDIVTEKRLTYAQELLGKTNLPVLDIAHRAGYHEYSHFNSLFKRHMGTTPAQYRASMKQGCE